MLSFADTFEPRSCDKAVLCGERTADTAARTGESLNIVYVAETVVLYVL